MSTSPKHILDPTQPVGSIKTEITPQNVFDAELAADMVKRTDKLNDTSIELALRVKQARDFMAWSANHVRSSWMDWMEQADKALKDITMLRMALDREGKAVTAAVKDVRDFFGSKEYCDASAKMKEMLQMLDQFQRLKADGTMDAFAEFILASCK